MKNVMGCVYYIRIMPIISTSSSKEEEKLGSTSTCTYINALECFLHFQISIKCILFQLLCKATSYSVMSFNKSMIIID